MVARIESVDPHPRADTLKVCRVDTGQERYQVICGAENARVGLKSVFAPCGATIPQWGRPLTERSIRGIASQGMLCSEKELGLSDRDEDIIELSDQAPLGERFADYLGLNETVIEIGLTPNRGDCAGVRGIARDLSASGLGRLKPLEIPSIESRFSSPIAVTIEDTTACPLFIGRFIRKVKNGESPSWLQSRLRAIGLRPISLLVDLTNYLTFDLGRPLHVFDADKLDGNLTVRLSRDHETLDALNGKTYVLDEGMTVICDRDRVVSLGGIVGGQATACQEETMNVFVECALFDPVRTASSSRRLRLTTDASYRFERGVDPQGVAQGMAWYIRKVLEYGGGEASAAVIAGQPIPQEKSSLTFDPKRIQTLGGVEIPPDEQVNLLRALGFTVVLKDDRLIDVTPPSWRHDIERPHDLVEEILRLRGFDQIPAVPLPRLTTVTPSPLSEEQKSIETIRLGFAARGLTEVVTWSFMPKELATEWFQFQDPSLQLLNPINDALEVMRPSIIPNLGHALQTNAYRGYNNLSLFEVGPIYHSSFDDKQEIVAAAVRAGYRSERHWSLEQRPYDVFDIKEDILELFASIGVFESALTLKLQTPGWYHPRRSGAWYWDATPIAYFGEIHPALVKRFDVSGPVVGCEMFLSRLPRVPQKRDPLHLSGLQSLTRDFSFILEAAVPAAQVIDAVRSLKTDLIADVDVFDLYPIDHASKALGLTITIAPQDHTLTDDEIETLSQRVVGAVQTQVNAVLRR